MNTSRKIWSEKEDNILTDVILVRKITKWSLVAKIMETQFDIPGRTGKQCRQRWHNQLDPNIKSEKWTDRQEELLYENHNQFGNKWAKISQYIPGRTDNCVKNHFYSNLRKALRRINLFIAQKKIPGDFRQIRPSILPKVIAVAEERFSGEIRQSNLSEQLIARCVDIKNKLSDYCKVVDLEAQEVPDLIELVKNIVDLSLTFKHNKASKLIRTTHGPHENLFKAVSHKQRFPVLQIEIQKHESLRTELPSSPAMQELCDGLDEHESMDQPITLDIKNLQGMELDSPTLPGFKLKKKRSFRVYPLMDQTSSDPSDQTLELEQINPYEAVIQLLYPFPVADEGCCL